MELEFDLSFLGDNSKEIKDRLQRFVDIYERLTDEQKAATKDWLRALTALEDKPPTSSFEPRIILGMMQPNGEDDYQRWLFPASFLLEAIIAMKQKKKFLMWEDDFDELLRWKTP